MFKTNNEWYFYVKCANLCAGIALRDANKKINIAI